MAKSILPQIDSKNNDFNTDQQPSSLWAAWWGIISQLQPAFLQCRTFLWFAVIVAGMSIRQDKFGATSIIRILKLKECAYYALRRNFHSYAIHLDELSALWARIVMRVFPTLRVQGKRVLVGDGIKVAKRGKKMPGVKLLHQESENKAEFIMGHSLQAVSVLVHAGESVMAVPLAARIHEGVVTSNRSQKTILNRMIDLLDRVDDGGHYYFVADAYYASKTIVFGLQEGNELITRVKCNAVAFLPYIHEGPRTKGRPRIYGDRIHVASLLKSSKDVQQAVSPVYGDSNVTLRYVVMDLLWKPLGRVVRFVVVEHPIRGTCTLMSTDITLDALEIIRLYGLRFKIEYSFKQAVHKIGTYSYHFWMRKMTPQHFGDGNQYIHRKSLEYREAVARKLHAYHVFVQAGIVAQGLMQYLAITCPKLVWNSFGSWLRTIRPGIAPSEFVVAEALRQSLPHFLLSNGEDHAFAKFITERQDQENMPVFARAA